MTFYLYSKNLTQKVQDEIMELMFFSYEEVTIILSSDNYLLVNICDKNDDIEQMVLSYCMEVVTNLVFGFIRSEFICNAQEIIEYLEKKDFSTKNFNDNDYLIDVIFNNILLKEKYKNKLGLIVQNEKPLVLLTKSLIENSINYSQTAIKNYLHRNTLINKMKRFEQLTQFNLRDFKDLYIIYTLLN